MKEGPSLKAHDVRKWHNMALKAGTATEAEAELVFWLHSYACDKGLNSQQVGELIGYDPSNVQRIYKMTYNEGNLGKRLYAAIKRAKEDAAVEEERSLYGKAGFVETSMAVGIFEACHGCRIAQEISQIWGEPQTGKSEALKRYTHLHDSGRTRYIELKSGMGHLSFMRYVATRCNAPMTGDVHTIRKAINRTLTPNTLLIFDELHKTLLHAGKTTKLKILDSIRDFNDEIGCGVMICGTNTLRDEITRGAMQEFLKQLNRRGVIKIQCPDTLPLQDVWLFADSYGLPVPKRGSDEYAMCQKVIRDHGISVFTKFLKAGMKLAHKRKARFGWNHFILAHDIIVKRNQPGWWKGMEVGR